MKSTVACLESGLSRRALLGALGGFAGALCAARSRLHAAPAIAPANEWQAISEQFLIDRNLVYLNTGTLGATPKPVLDARHALEATVESNPSEGFGSVLREAEGTSAKVAELIGCDPKEATVTRNTTEGMNFIAEGIGLQPGQRVLTSNQEHGSGLAAWKFLQKHRGIEIDVAEIKSPPESEEEIVDSFRKAIRPQTRVIMCSLVHFSNGVMSPIKQLSELAHKHGCLMIVDGAQSTGGVPVSVTELGCDAYASSGHKFLLGPKGTGILYISSQARERIKPMQLEDGYGYYTAIRGTSCMIEAACLGVAIDWFKQIGREAVYGRLMSLRNRLYDVLRGNPHIQIASPPPESPLASQLLCYKVPDRERLNRLQAQFTKDKVIFRGGLPNGIDHRLSVHLYNTEADIDRFAESLKQGTA